MSQHVWASPRLFATYGGDVLLAQSYTRHARVYVGYLFDQLRPGQTFRTDSWLLENGVSISAQVWRDDLGERAAVRIIAPGVEEAADILYCDAGLLYWNSLAPTYPLKIQVGPRIKRLFQNMRSPQDSRFWLDTRPDIEYGDEISGIVPLAYWPSFWSGRARLMMQGLHAKARSPVEVFGAEPNPNGQGIWIANGNWWLVRINATVGVTIDRLYLPDSASSKAHKALLKARGGVGGETELAIAEACAMAEMVPEGDPQEIIRPSLISDIVAQGNPLFYGWKFARGKPLASIVTLREEYMPEFPGRNIGQFVANLFTIEADYDKVSGWTGSVSNPYGPVRSRPRTGITSIWYPQYGYPTWVMAGLVPEWGTSTQPACCYSPIGDTISPYYCWYDKADALQVVWYVQYQEETEYFDERGEIGTSCQPSFSWDGDHGTRGEMRGGFHVGTAPPALSMYTDDVLSYASEAYRIMVSGGNFIFVDEDAPSTSMTNYYYGASCSCQGGEVNQWVGDHFNQIKHVNLYTTHGSQDEHYEYRDKTADHRLWSFIVSPNDCEAVYVLAVGKSTSQGPLMTYDWSGSYYGDGETQPVNGGQLRFEFYSLNPYNEVWETFTVDTLRSEEPNRYNFGGWTGYSINRAKNYSYGNLIEEEPATSSPEPNVYRVYTPHGYINLSTDAYWPTMFPESVLDGLYTDQMPVQCLFSYLGDGMYFDGEGAQIDSGEYTLRNKGIGEMFIGGA